MNYNIAYLLLRLGIGLSFFGHGLVRLPKLSGFSAWMVKSFEHSMVPASLVTPFSYILPIAEFVVGLLLIIGLFTRFSLIAGSIVMLALIFGTTMIENWDALPSQLIHLGLLEVLLVFIQYNAWAVDRRIKG
jgi:thiosulfate dehydrogenase [quinone] large subunit